MTKMFFALSFSLFFSFLPGFKLFLFLLFPLYYHVFIIVISSKCVRFSFFQTKILRQIARIDDSLSDSEKESIPQYSKNSKKVSQLKDLH